MKLHVGYFLNEQGAHEDVTFMECFHATHNSY